MARTLAHRGPDDEGVHLGERVALGNRRLEILDLQRGRQPLSNEDGTVWVTFNGEIYNFLELRRELEVAGHHFRTRTDTEVLVHLYEEEGENLVHRLRGMFAFAIWDERRDVLFAARDRFGQKPFFYAREPGRFIFASEIKALLAYREKSVEPEPAAIDYFLTFRFTPPPLTMFRGISKLPAAHALRWADGELDVYRYWELDFRRSSAAARRSEREWLDGLGEQLGDAVRSHLTSDVPVGALLSGGLDSSTVVALMAREAGPDFPTFCIGSEDPDFDERPHARIVAEQVGTRHRERVVDGFRLEDIHGIVRALDEPSDPIAPCFEAAARLSAEQVKVVLGGDGGDELFAGFDRYAAFRWAGWYLRLPRWVRHELIRPLAERLPHSLGYKAIGEKARWLVSLESDTAAGRYARMNSFFRFGREERERLYGPALEDTLRKQEAEEAVARPFREAPASDPLHRMVTADLVTRLPEHTLMLSDRLAMAHGLEVRSPLLDHHLAEFTALMPTHLKARWGRTKIGLRRVAANLLPKEIVRRKKQGFQLPVARWLNEDTAPTIHRTLLSGPTIRYEWIRGKAVEALLSEHLTNRADHHVRLWMLLNLDAWARIYLEGERDSAAAGLSEELVPRARARPARAAHSDPS